MAAIPILSPAPTSSTTHVVIIVLASTIQQVWPLTQYYSFDFLQSRIGESNCVFNKRTIKVCVSLGINKRSDFGLRTGTEVFKTGFYKGTFRAQTGTIVHSSNFLVLFRPQ